jgi:hypothetical protein
MVCKNVKKAPTMISLTTYKSSLFCLILMFLLSLSTIPAVFAQEGIPPANPTSVQLVGMADFFDPDRQLLPTYEHRIRSIPDLHRAGVGILAGSDMAGGFPLHDELSLFVEAGLSPLDALRTATLNPASYLMATDSFGTVEVGKVADLVLLEANPLEDISNTQRIAAVVANGRYFDRNALDRMLSEAERAANEPKSDKE